MVIRIIRTGFVLLLACSLVWALVLAWWADRLHTPSPRDMLLYMALLPLALLGGYALLRAFIDGLRYPAVPAAAPQPAISAQTSTPPEQLRPALWRPLKASFVHTAQGAGVAQLRNALEAGKRPGPDPQLRDADGFPVFAGRVEALDCDDLAARLDTLASRIGAAPIHQPAIVRALAILEHALPDILAALDEAPTESSATATLAPRLCWFVPQSWPSHCFPMLEAWLLEHREVLEHPPGEIRIVPAASTAELLQVLFGEHPADAGSAPLLVMAAESSLAEDVILGWEHAGTLFNAHNQHGRIPGEAAAALLFGPPRCDPADDIGAARMAEAVRDRRPAPPGTHNSTKDETLSSVRSRAMSQAQLQPEQIGVVIGDIDHRAASAVEVFTALGDEFGHLDPSTDVLALGAGCGDTGIVAPLLALALASELATQDARPALCLFAQDSIDRAAVVVTPAPARPLS